ncbi:hypothetical protein RU639_008345 [Aspergillus parasiticus]
MLCLRESLPENCHLQNTVLSQQGHYNNHLDSENKDQTTRCYRITAAFQDSGGDAQASALAEDKIWLEQPRDPSY